MHEKLLLGHCFANADESDYTLLSASAYATFLQHIFLNSVKSMITNGSSVILTFKKRKINTTVGKFKHFISMWILHKTIQLYQICHGLSLIFSKDNNWETLTEDTASLRSILFAKNKIGIRRCLISKGEKKQDQLFVIPHHHFCATNFEKEKWYIHCSPVTAILWTLHSTKMHTWVMKPQVHISVALSK